MKNIEKCKIEDKNKDWLLNTCFERFGSMNKGDYEVALFTLLLRSGWSEMSDFDISRALKLTETKVKRLRYESNLVYPLEDNMKDQLKAQLKKAKYKLTDSNKIQFIISDKLLRLYANNVLEQEGSFADSSFNASVVSVTPEDLVLLINFVADQKDDSYKILNKAKTELRNSVRGLPMDTKETLTKFAKAFVKDTARRFAPNVTECMFEYLEHKYGIDLKMDNANND